jgi:hypothetical protein
VLALLFVAVVAVAAPTPCPPMVAAGCRLAISWWQHTPPAQASPCIDDGLWESPTARWAIVHWSNIRGVAHQSQLFQHSYCVIYHCCCWMVSTMHGLKAPVQHTATMACTPCLCCSFLSGTVVQ